MGVVDGVGVLVVGFWCVGGVGGKWGNGGFLVCVMAVYNSRR